MNKSKVVLILAASLLTSSLLAGETRTHYRVATRDRAAVLEATVIMSSSEEKMGETYLFKTAAGQRLRVDVERNFPGHKTVAEYRVNDGKPVRVTLHLPYKSNNRSDTIAEMRRGVGRNEDIPITVEGKGKTFQTSEGALKGDTDGKVKQNAKALVEDEIANAFRSIQAVLGFPQFGGACSTIALITGDKCRADASMMVATVFPDCAFDASLGQPCDATQVAKAKDRKVKLSIGPY